MAARNRRIHVDPATRERIAVTQIVKRLNLAALGEVEMDGNQIAAARILLDKSLPSLASVEAHNTNVHTTISSEPLPEAEWAQKFGGEAVEKDTIQ